MKRLSTAVAAIALIGTPAIAADMAVKSPAPMPAPVYNWTGWYAGVNSGASFGNVKTDFNTDTVAVNIGGLPPTVPGFSQSDRVYPSGFMGGGQIGYNWQYSPLIVVGLEADFQGALEKDSATLTRAFDLTEFGDVDVIGTATTNYEAKIDWFGTVWLRAGYVWGNGDVFTYVTGGLAYGKVELDATSTVSGTAAGIPFSTIHAFSHSEIKKVGWWASVRRDA